MYPARPDILAECGLPELDSVYFTQSLLKDYLEAYEPDWKVVWDARGNLIEPHTDRRVALGGKDVREYMAGWHSRVESEMPDFKSLIDTKGPRNRFSNCLFIEREGFAEILADAGIGTRYDMAIMSTKGIPVDAACDLIAAMEAKGVRTLSLHDFDYWGFKIARTLRNGTRLSTSSNVIDLGFRMDDIAGLPSEPVYYKQRDNPAHYLIGDCDVTEAEAAFLVEGRSGGGWHGQRVELNAMTSEQLIVWLDRILEQHGVRKVVPDGDTLTSAYRRALFLQRMQSEIESRAKSLAKEIEEDGNVPRDLATRIKKLLSKTPTMSWDDAVWQIAGSTRRRTG
jgi:hypothetical protein